MEIISSNSNKFVKLARSLAEKKYRDQTGLFLVEGGNSVYDMPDSAMVEFFLVSERRAEEFEFKKPNRKAPCYMVTDSVMQSLSDTVTPYGVAAVVKKPDNIFFEPGGNALILDGVSDSGNLGTIFRTAAAAGFNDIYLLSSADAYSPKVVRASMSAIFKVRTAVIDEDKALYLAKGYNGVALDMGGEDIKNLKIDKPVTLILGSEAHGVRDSLIKAAKKTVRIDMKNNMESLNVAVAAGIAMYFIN
ncbi:MAG: RNA methyltransferase [Clostridiales bacterium]|nr:RNA methyltransferase [Clostridiales bacterium]